MGAWRSLRNGFTVHPNRTSRRNRITILGRRKETSRAYRFHLSVPGPQEPDCTGPNEVSEPRPFAQAGDVHEHRHVAFRLASSSSPAGPVDRYRQLTVM